MTQLLAVEDTHDTVSTTNTEDHSDVVVTDTAEDTHAEVAHDESTNPALAVAHQFGLNGQMFAAQLLNFLIVMLILWAFVYKPVVKMLDERQKKIEDAVKNAEKIDVRLSAIESEKDNILKEAKKEAQHIAEKAQRAADERHEEIVTAAKREVERVIAKGKAQLADEKAAMLKDMRKDIVDIAMKAAARITQDQIDEKKSQSLAEEVVRKMT